MPPISPASELPRVAAVLVVTDEARWLGHVLATVTGQRYPALDLVVIDNGTRDGAADLLRRQIPADRLITLPRRVGYGRAVAAAAQHPAVAGAELLWLLHDDLALAPSALTRLVTALQEDPALGIVGPKLREWRNERILAEVGMTIDRLGRAESLLEPAEVDQGQHDRQREVLYVNTAAMLLRTQVLRDAGSFDPRLLALRDDLDLCWRAWLAGHRVAVVPAAVGYHAAATSRYLRPVGRGRARDARELAERHSLVALLKNYGWARLAWVLPVVVLVALAKAVAFLATRRFGDALAVARAYGWNLVQLPRTLRRRRIVQSRRAVSDAELSSLFAPGIPRVRAYAEALGEWIAGGSTRALYDEQAVVAAEPAGGGLRRAVRDHPAGAAAVLLGLAYLIGVLPLLGPGQITGGGIAPWPASAWDFLRSYASPWNGEPVASAGIASPLQAVLGLGSFLGLGSAWLAQRLLVLGLPPLGWVLALRAGRLVTPRPGPRALGATLYVLSPAVLGALGQGRYGVLVAASLLPGVVLLAVRAADPHLQTATGWRAAALAALSWATVTAAAPVLGGLLLLGTPLLWRQARAAGGDTATRRVLVAAGGGIALVAPWLGQLALAGGLGPAGPAEAPLPFWRAVTLTPPTVDLLGPVGAGMTAAATIGVLLMGVGLGLRHRPRAVAGLAAVHVGAALAAWGASRGGLSWVWPPALLVPAALAVGGLAVIAALWVRTSLREYAFGARQLGVVAAAVAVLAGLGAGAARLASAPFPALARAADVLPAFVMADEPRVGPYRVVVVHRDDGRILWDVTGASGPTMQTYGTTPSRRLLGWIEQAIAAAAGGADQAAGRRLGLANVRYLVVNDADAGDRAALAEVFGRQPDLEPLPVGGGQVYRVSSWLPRAVVVGEPRAAALLRGADVGSTADLADLGLRQVSPGRYVGGTGQTGVLVVSEARSALWQAAGPTGALTRQDLGPVNAFPVPVAGGPLIVAAAGGLRHGALIAGQLLLLLAIVSLALRPPGTALRGLAAATAELPAVLADDADATEAAQAAVSATSPGPPEPAPPGGQAPPPPETPAEPAPGGAGPDPRPAGAPAEGPADPAPASGADAVPSPVPPPPQTPGHGERGDGRP